MACPYFLPERPVAGFSDVSTGTCAAQNGEPADRSLLERSCNQGYARSACECAARSESDAFRFAVKAWNKQFVDVAWSSERNHHPLAVGTLTVDISRPPDTPLERQAWICASDFIRSITPRN